MLKRSSKPSNGETLAGQLDDVYARFEEDRQRIAAEAAEREAVVKARLAELEAEKSVLADVRSEATIPLT